MYCWTLLTGDIHATPFQLGVTSDLARAMRLCEPYLISGQAFLGFIEAVRTAMTAHCLDSCYVRTGRTWTGRRNNRNGVTWIERAGDFGLGPVPLLG
jgi:hypothetical protein